MPKEAPVWDLFVPMGVTGKGEKYPHYKRLMKYVWVFVAVDVLLSIFFVWIFVVVVDGFIPPIKSFMKSSQVLTFLKS